MAPLYPKRLKAKEPRLTKKYRKQVKAKMASSGFKLRSNNFKLKAKIEWNQQLQRQYDALQKDNTAIRKEVESKLWKLRMGGVPWSPEITRLRNTIKLWAMMVRKKSRVKVSVKRIRQFLLKVPKVRNAFSCSLAEAIHHRNLAYQEYKEMGKTEALPLREKFQGTIAEAIALKKGTNVETEAKRLQTMERQRRQGRNIKRMQGTYGNSRVTKMWFTEPNGTKIQCDTQLSMERACFEETRLNSANPNKPLLCSPQP
jgi:hypothetical protein